MPAADIDVDVGLITCVWDRIGQMARRSTPERSRTHGFNLIPVSGVREVVGGVSEAVSDEKKRGNGVEGTFNKDMTTDGMIFEAQKQIVKPSSQTCNHIWRAWACATRKKCSCVRTVRCYLFISGLFF